jgi:hypothetical protein
MSDDIEKQDPATAEDAASIDRDGVDKVGPKHDDATQYLHTHESQYSSYSLQDAKRVLRKIDWRLMPLMWITTNISAIDARSPEFMLRNGQFF